MSKIIRPLRGGQITIPADFRKQLGITQDSVLQLSLEGAELRIKPLHIRETAQGTPWLKELYDLFAPVREEAASLGKEEIDAAIKEAVTAARKKHD